MARAIEELVGLGPAFDGARVATAWTVRYLINGAMQNALAVWRSSL